MGEGVLEAGAWGGGVDSNCNTTLKMESPTKESQPCTLGSSRERIRKAFIKKLFGP